MKVLGNRLLVRLDIASADSPIIAPELSRKMPDTGVILLRGSGEDIPAELQPGLRVRVDNGYGSTETTFDGRKARIYSVKDLLAILQ